MKGRRKMAGIRRTVLLGIAALVFAMNALAADVERDVVIYGSTPAALTAAISAQKSDKTAVIVCPERRIGGLTTGGLGQTDIGNKRAFGGLALRFYRDVADHYRGVASWTREMRTDYLPDGQCAGTKGEDSMWTFEPSAALRILEGWERGYGLDIRRGEFLDRSKVTVEGEGERRKIVSIVTLSGNVYCGRMFVDATYEGDLMAAAGVSYTVGREDNARYGETLSGCQRRQAKFHQVEKGVSGYVTPGDPSSGLLPGLMRDDGRQDGTGDAFVQAYCFRMCLTDVPENRIPFKKPANYDESAYELLFRNLAAQEAAHPEWKDDRTGWNGFGWINSRMPNRKTDTNNRLGVSTDFIGRNWNWPEASYEERTRIFQAHLDYQRGLMWTLANHPRVPARLRAVYSQWGTCRDEFADGAGDGWQSQLYVREARRMVGDYVMTEANCRGAKLARRPVAMAAYTMDSHHVRRLVDKDGNVFNEGDVEVGVDERGERFPPYPIDYGALVPKRGECANLFVPVCLSASHIAFGSIRMEPVFFALGQVAGTAAAQAIDAGCAVQNLAYGPLRARLLADGQVLSVDPPRYVRIAAANSSAADRRNADAVCRGEHDEAVFNTALSWLEKGGTLQMADGDYYFDGFPAEGNAAVCAGSNGGVARVLNLIGTTENKAYNTAFGAVIHVTEKALKSIDPAKGEYCVFGGSARRPNVPPGWLNCTYVNNMNFENFFLKFHDASKPLIGIDCRRFGSVYMKLVGIYSEQYFNDRFAHLKPAVPAKGTVGIVSTHCSNDEMARVGFDWVNVGGLHTGFRFVGMDHVVMRSCSAARCCYGYDFSTMHKTLTLVNCCDEGNTHLPVFRGKGQLTAIDFNIERFDAAYIPDDPDGNAEPYATEEKPASWNGTVSYTLQGKAFGLRGFWKDGHGAGFQTRQLNPL